MVYRELGEYIEECGILITRKNNDRTQMIADYQENSFKSLTKVLFYFILYTQKKIDTGAKTILYYIKCRIRIDPSGGGMIRGSALVSESCLLRHLKYLDTSAFVFFNHT